MILLTTFYNLDYNLTDGLVDNLADDPPGRCYWRCCWHCCWSLQQMLLKMLLTILLAFQAIMFLITLSAISLKIFSEDIIDNPTNDLSDGFVDNFTDNSASSPQKRLLISLLTTSHIILCTSSLTISVKMLLTTSPTTLLTISLEILLITLLTVLLTTSQIVCWQPH